MVLRLARHSIGALGIVALVSLPGSAFSQADPERTSTDDKERVAEEIVAAQAEEGPRSPALIQLLTELGVLYETEGQYALATAALEEARALVRANYGLHTLDQVPLLQQAFANQQALGNFAMVRALEEEMLDLADRNPGDLRAAFIYRDAGRRRQEVLRQFLAGEAPNEVYTEGAIYSFWRNDMIRALVSDAQIRYADAAAVMLRNGLFSSTELRDLEIQIVRTSDIVRQRSRPSSRSRPTTLAAAPVTLQGTNTFSRVSNNRSRTEQDRPSYDPELERRMNTLSALAERGPLRDAPGVLRDANEGARGGNGVTSGYEVGRDSYRRLIAYDEIAFGSDVSEAGLRARLESYLQLADWDLLYSHNGTAFDQYASLYQLLQPTAVGEHLIAEIFAPRIPIVLPTFLPNPLDTPESARYIEASFEVTKFGESRRIEIVGASADVSDAAKDELANVIKSARFRPRVAGGEVGRPAPIVFRYYLND